MRSFVLTTAIYISLVLGHCHAQKLELVIPSSKHGLGNYNKDSSLYIQEILLNNQYATEIWKREGKSWKKLKSVNGKPIDFAQDDQSIYVVQEPGSNPLSYLNYREGNPTENSIFIFKYDIANNLHTDSISIPKGSGVPHYFINKQGLIAVLRIAKDKNLHDADKGSFTYYDMGKKDPVHFEEHTYKKGRYQFARGRYYGEIVGNEKKGELEVLNVHTGRQFKVDISGIMKDIFDHSSFSDIKQLNNINKQLIVIEIVNDHYLRFQGNSKTYYVELTTGKTELGITKDHFSYKVLSDYIVENKVFLPTITKTETANQKILPKKIFDYINSYSDSTSKLIGYNDYSFETSKGKILIKGTNVYTKEGSSEKKIGDLPFATSQPEIVNDHLMIKFFDSYGLYDISNLELKARIYTFKEGRLDLVHYDPTPSRELLVIRPDGKFDGTQRIIDSLHFSRGLEILPMDLYFEDYYTPNLLRLILGGYDLGSIKNINDLSLPPSISFIDPLRETKQKEISLKLDIDLPEGELEKVLLYKNGKLIETRTDFTSSNAIEFQVGLSSELNGQNIFVAKAINSEGTESKPALHRIIYGGSYSSKPNLYLLSIGINDYLNPKYDLNYAVGDSEAFSQKYLGESTGIFDEVKVFEIKNQNATKSKIESTFRNIINDSKESDLFVFYYAGHGVMQENQEGKEKFYLVLHDISSMYGNTSILEEKGISESELRQWSEEIQARKQLFVLDACQSGAAIDLLATRGASEEKAMAQLARSTGTFWLAASGSEQYATELQTLGHGVFTYALLEGLDGEADGGKKDGIITVKELGAFIEYRVPELSKKYKGKPQYPNGFGYGQDFPLVHLE